MNKLSLATALCVTFASCLPGAVLYAPAPIGSSARVSDYGATSQVGFRTFDNFTVASGGTVEKITWTGFWLDFGNPVPSPPPAPDVLNWEISFHADNAGIPGAQLLFESVAAANVSSTFLGTGVFNAGSSYNVSFYQYSVDLASPFALGPATQYWLSVMSRSDPYNPAFVLQGATGGDDSSYQEQLGAALSVVGANLVARDRAFVLEGTVPEPSTVLISAAGLLLLPLLRSRFGR